VPIQPPGVWKIKVAPIAVKALAERNFLWESYSQHTVGHAGHEIFRSNEADDHDPKFALARCGWTIPKEVESRLIGELFYLMANLAPAPGASLIWKAR
jgi:hypothetical protein